MKDFIYAAMIAILAIFSYQQCSSKAFNSNLYEKNMEAKNDSISYYKNKNGENVATIKSIQLEKGELKKFLKEKGVELKRVKAVLAYMESHQEVRIDTIEVEFKDSIPCVFNKDFTISDEWYSFNQKLSQKGSTVTDFLLKNKQDIMWSWKYKKKENIFQKSKLEIRAEITNSNPYFKTTHIEPYIITVRKKWYEKPLVTVPLGILIGYGLAR